MKRPRWFSAHRHNDGDLDEEIRAHLNEKVDALVASGLSQADAMAMAKREFGNVSLITERSRDIWRWPWLEALKMDTRHALRLIRRYPAFSTNVILISAIGIAACATTFSLVSGVILSPLPFANPDDVYSFELTSGMEYTSGALRADTYLDIAAGSPVLDGIAAGYPSAATMRWGNEPTQVKTERVTSSYFRVFGVTPMYGRQFTAIEAENDTPVALLGHSVWRARFNADSAVVGTTIVLDSVPRTIVGIMPARFRAHYSTEPDVWVPLHVSLASGLVNAQVRVREGVTKQQAESWLSTVVHERIESPTGRDSVNAKPLLVPIRELVYGNAERPLRILLASVILVLLLIAANVATMFLARTSARDHELGVRRALGASTGRQMGQLVTESVVLVVVGGTLGVLASFWMVAMVRSLGERVLPRMDAVGFDWRVAAFALLATTLTGVIGGLFPAFAARHDLRNPSSGSRITGKRTSTTLVVAQISLSMMLLVGAGLLVKGFLRVMPSTPGFATKDRSMLAVSLRGYKAPSADSNAALYFTAQVSERMKRVPGVGAVAARTFMPFSGSTLSAQVELTGYPPPVKPYSAIRNFVTPNLMQVLEIQLRHGRGFTERDDASGERVGIVNETAARRWWPGENPVGKRVTLKRGKERVPITVVGVMSDGRMYSQDTKIRPEVYIPLAQENYGYVTFIVHTERNAGAALQELKKAVWAVAPDLPIGSNGSLETFVSDSVQRPRFYAWAMGAFAAVAVLLSSVAVYGLLTLDVVERRQEIGVRMALGATGIRVGRLVLQRAARLAFTGVVIGVLSARALSKYMESLLVEVTATDASVFAGSAALAIVIASLAACAPAYRAVKVDPSTCLRGE